MYSKGRKKSKRWCSSGRDVPIWEKFEDDDEKRIVFPINLRMKKEDVAYVYEAADRKEWTNSRMFEYILDKYFCTSLSEGVLLLPHTLKKLKYVDTRKIPKWSIHPAYVDMFKKRATTRGLTFTMMMSEIFLAYKEKYPKSIRAKYLHD